MMGLCSLLSQVGFLGGGLICEGQGGVAAFGAVVALVAAIAAVVFAARAPLGRARRVIGAGCMITAAAALALASGDPALKPDRDRVGGRVIAVVDVSASLRRDVAGYSAALAGFTDWAARRVAAIPAAERGNWRAGTIAFDGSAALASADAGIETLAAGIGQARGATTRAGGSNLAEGLQAALALVKAAPMPSEIMLLSDGNWLEGDLAEAVSDVVRAGVPVNVMAAGSRRPAAGIIAHDLAATQTAGARAVIRAVLRGQGKITAQTGSDGTRTTSQVPAPVAGAGQPVRVTTVFPSRGIRIAQLTFEAEDGARDQLVMMANVKGPAQITAFGSAPWLSAVPSERFELSRRDPQDGLPDSFSDVIVLDAVNPQDFPQGFDQELAARVIAGAGLFVTNGRHSGDLEQPTLMAGWEQTAIGPYLPVNSDGREVLRDHPPREVVIVLDASGSMGGARLQTAKALAVRVINALRDVDKVEVVRFASDMNVRANLRRMDAPGKLAAIAAVNGISAGGGTDPTQALAYAGKFAGNYCGIFFISDGDFASVPNPPGCFTTVFEVNEGGLLRNPHLAQIGDVQAVRTGASLSKIAFKYLEPEPRTETFRPGPFQPLSVGDDPALTPPLDVKGLAISYPRVDAERLSVHADLPADPLVAFRRDTQNRLAHTGVFMSEVPPSWATEASGVHALTAYMDRLVGWSDPDRYAMTFDPGPEAVEITIQPTAGSDTPLARLSALVVLADGREIPALTGVEQKRGQFAGRLALPTGSGPQAGLLLIREDGEIVQRIPISLPVRRAHSAATSGDEAYSFGINHQRLQWLADTTGGQMLTAGSEQQVPRLKALELPRPLHPALIVASLLLIALGLWVGRGRR